MDLETRKLDLIEYLIQLTDEKVFNVIESAIINITSEIRNTVYDAADAEELQHADALPAGRIMTLDELESEVESW